MPFPFTRHIPFLSNLFVRLSFSSTKQFNMATFLNTLPAHDQLRAAILFVEDQRRSQRKQLKDSKKMLRELQSLASSYQAPDASALPLPSFFHMLPASPTPVDHLDWLEMTPSVVEDARSQASSEHIVIDVAPGPSGDDAVSTEDDTSSNTNTKGKKHGPHRNFRSLSNILTNDTPIFIESTGDRWDGVFRVVDGKGIFTFNGTDYASPAAVSKAHASRVTESHPKATKPGNGWNYICVAATSKTIGEVYDAANIV